MILGQEEVHIFRTLECFETDRKSTPIAVRLPLGWISSGPLSSTSGFFSTCSKAVTQNESDFTLAGQIRSWYGTESFGAYKQVDPCSASDGRAEKMSEDTTYHDGCRYLVGILWADDRSTLPKN